ncbi:MAG: hypothetical protein AAF067_04565 [Pseudomonadota bacterium]
MMSKSTVTLLLRISAILWVIWGLVHAFAGIMTISLDTPSAIAGIADAVDPSTLEMAYPDAAGAIINQHGFNLLWIGIVTFIGGLIIWRESVTAIFVTALIGWTTDLGYFIFVDMGGYVNFVPGTVMTIISTAAVILSFLAYFRGIKLKPGS